jgi:DNA processing protein
MKIQTLTIDSPDYPEYLREIAGPPKQLYYLGDLIPLLSRPRLAVIGSRKVTPYGKGITSTLTREVAGQGVVIISGLALGVDGLAHKAALEVNGKTIAVLAGGLDSIHPPTHRYLAEQILRRGGALISEYPVGEQSWKPNFIARNRIVSGLSEGVLITEAAEKSGTLHTANFALDQGRTVMAVPGNITSSLSAGTNNLIKAGAVPITSSADICEALGLQPAQATEHLAANEHEAIIIDLLKDGISDASELLTHSELSAPLFNQTLTMLEITGKIRPLGAGHWALS